jgi:hypothetical protein
MQVPPSPTYHSAIPIADPTSAASTRELPRETLLSGVCVCVCVCVCWIVPVRLYIFVFRVSVFLVDPCTCLSHLFLALFLFLFSIFLSSFFLSFFCSCSRTDCLSVGLFVCLFVCLSCMHSGSSSKKEPLLPVAASAPPPPPPVTSTASKPMTKLAIVTGFCNICFTVRAVMLLISVDFTAQWSVHFLRFAWQGFGFFGPPLLLPHSPLPLSRLPFLPLLSFTLPSFSFPQLWKHTHCDS